MATMVGFSRGSAWAAVVGLLVLAGCTPQSTSEKSCAGQLDSPPTPGTHEAIGWKNLRASSGGRVDIPDGAWLDVPPGALPCDSTITVRISKTPYGGVKTYLLEPSGMQFEKPVVLNVPYGEPVPGVEPLMIAYSSSASTPWVKAGAEETNWEPVEVDHRDEENNVLALSLEHFTFVYVAVHVDEDAYLVVDLPDKYLRLGDALFTLTAHDDAHVESNWMPGHVAMVYRLPDEKKGRPVAHLVEATPPKVRSLNAGVIKVEEGHIFLGARRPPDPLFSDLQRSDATFTASAHIGDPYSVIGQGNVGLGSWSCVGFVEYCWDSVERGVLDEWREVTAATPLEMFRATRPVAEISERIRQPIVIPIYGVTLSPDSAIVARTFRGFYQKKENYELFADNLPEGATFTGSAAAGYRFEWTPKVEQGCVHVGGTTASCLGGAETYLIPLRMRAYPQGLLTPYFSGNIEVNQTLTVRVTGGTAVKTVAPSNGNGTASHLIGFGITKGAFVHSLEFIDEDTGQPPSDTPFPNQILTVTGKACANDNCAVTFDIKNTVSSVPTGTKKFRLTADYSVLPVSTGP
ncbi:MAG: hypothetical protein HYZ29_14950 [Myxococcales bacterium]|nr:hypothetical protein [Myxococcales bacterium]